VLEEQGKSARKFKERLDIIFKERKGHNQEIMLKVVRRIIQQ